MPIIYMHGVNTRSPTHFAPVREYLRRIVAPAIASDPENVSIRAADWFPFCPPPKWEGISRPRTRLLGQGAADGAADEVLDAIASAVAVTQAARSDGFTSGQISSSAERARLDGLPPDKLADLITRALRSPPRNGEVESEVEAIARARIGIAADRIARDPSIRGRLKVADGLGAQLRILGDAVETEVKKSSSLREQGAIGDFFHGMRDRVTESIARVIDTPAAAATVIAGELRPVLNDFVTRFIGDVMFYMTRRGTPQMPGDIPSTLLKELELAQVNKRERKGEPIVLLTHSMGGQIAYDVITSFLPTAKSPIKIDFWCATASQVGFFEELNMFLASSADDGKATGKRTPLVDINLGKWWNVWDSNDIISFTTKGIFAEGIDDEEFWSGMSIAAAHGGYLERPSFYRRFADKLEEAFPGWS